VTDGKSSYRSISPWLAFKLTKYLLSARSKKHFIRRLLTELLAASGEITPIELSELAALNELTVESNLREGALAALVAKAVNAKSIFEFGTFRGKTSMLLAATCAEAEIVTLDLPDDRALDFNQTQVSSRIEITCANLFTEHRGSLIKGELAKRIAQIRQNSADFDPTPYLRRFDFIYIDGSHSYSAAASDTRKALAMLKAGGTIMWDDYPRPGVWRYLNELNRERPELGLCYLHNWDKVVTAPVDSPLRKHAVRAIAASAAPLVRHALAGEDYERGLMNLNQ
jgi:predicted O-methyltransferase YrrM